MSGKARFSANAPPDASNDGSPFKDGWLEIARCSKTTGDDHFLTSLVSLSPTYNPT